MAEREEPAQRQPGGLPRLPPGRHGLAREFVVRNQRDRLTAGIIASVAERGYHETTVSQICAAAGVSRRTFYTYFSAKEECFLQAFDLVFDHLVAAMREAGGEGDSWPQRVRARFAAMLAVFAANPDLVRFALVAPLRAGGEIAARHRPALDRVLAELTRGRPRRGVRRASPAVEGALVGGIMSLVARQVERGEGEDLAALLPDLVELFLTPYLGHEEALAVAAPAA